MNFAYFFAGMFAGGFIYTLTDLLIEFLTEKFRYRGGNNADGIKGN